MVKRRKIRKNKDEDSPIEKKMKEKDGEVAIARGRLAGALKGILNHDSDEQESSCSSNQVLNFGVKKQIRDSSPALWKKQNHKSLENDDHQSYLMKLFDRSVDLAQFDINTPLYPICRAWIQNKPLSKNKNNGLLEIRHDGEDNDSQFFELKERPSLFIPDDRDVIALPPPKPLPDGVHTLRIPPSEHREIQEINLNSDFNETPSKEELLQSHLKNWTTERKRWRVASQKNETRYIASKAVLTKMFEKAQVQFHPMN